MKKSKKDVQIEAVKGILSGDLLVEEAMAKYGVKDKRTILGWMKAISPLIQHHAVRGTVIQEEVDTPADVQQYILKENLLLRRVIGLQDKLRDLEEKNAQIMAHRDLLMDKVMRLEIKLKVQSKQETTPEK